ncbi:MAG TPA: hypothetical protein VF786_00940 [Terriglobales bacterium]
MMFFREHLRYADAMRFRTQFVLVMSLFASICVSAQTSLSGLLYTFPDQHAEVSKIPAVTLSQNCLNYVWAAEIEFLARQQDVPLSQTEIIDRANGGACVDSATDLDKMKSVIDGERVLPDGSHVKLELQITNGTPLSSDELLAQLSAGRSLIISWHGHPYVAVGAIWDDYVYAPAQRMHKIRELRLLDLAKPADKQAITFKPDPEELPHLGSTVQIVCTKLNANPWAPAAPASW